MRDWMRANWGNPTLEIWFQGPTTSFWGEAPPVETNFAGAKLMRDAQIGMARNISGFKIGSYVPHSNRWDAYLNEMAIGIGWVHYTVEEYHATAKEMGESIGGNKNLVFSPPLWASVEMPDHLDAVKLPNGDVRFTWATESLQFKVRVHNPNDSSVLAEAVVTDNTYLYTRAAQVSHFGNEAVYVHLSVAHFDEATGAGPYGTFVGSVYGTALQEPRGLGAVKNASGDIVMRWDGRAGRDHYLHRNISAVDMTVLTEQVVSGTELNFTYAAQVAAYGYDALFASFELYEYDASRGAVGPKVGWSGDSARAAEPSGGLATKAVNGDITLTWDAKGAATWLFELVNVSNGTVVRSSALTAPVEHFTAAEQVAVCGYTVGYVEWRVTAVNVGGAASLRQAFSASV